MKTRQYSFELKDLNGNVIFKGDHYCAENKQEAYKLFMIDFELHSYTHYVGYKWVNI